MVTTTFAFIVFVIGFGFLIFIHELGHFLVAKWVGIRCTQFAIGFGPAIVSWRKGIGFRVGSTEPAYRERAAAHLRTNADDPNPIRVKEDASTLHEEAKLQEAADELGLGETEYRLNYLPLGGYVKMLGQEDLDPSARSANPNAFSNKSVGARFAVISAGVIMNMITGILFFLVAFMAGVDFPPPVVGPIAPGSPASTAVAVGHEDDPAFRGLRVGDEVLLVDGVEPIDYTDVRVAAALGARGEPIELTVKREGVTAPITYRVTADEGGMDLLDFGFDQPRSLEVALVLTESDAYRAGIRPGMRAVSAAGEPLKDYTDLHRRVTAARGEPVPVVFEATPEAFEKIEQREAAAAKAAGPEAPEAMALTPRVEMTLRAAPPLVSSEDVPLDVAGFYPPVRVTPEPGSAAAEAGVKAGDLLRELGGTVWPRLEEVSTIVQQAGDRPLEVTVLRDGSAEPLGPIQPRNGILGINMGYALDGNVVGGVVERSSAAALDGFVPGSRLLRVAGEEVRDWYDLCRILSDLEVNGQTVSVPVEYVSPLPDDAPVAGELELTAAQVAALRDTQWALNSAGAVFEFDRVTVVADDAWGAMSLGLRKTKSFMGQAYVMILRLFQGSVPANQLSGPVGITAVGTQVAETGWSYLFYFLGLLSVNLAVINFLPIPIADGGHAVFLLVEKLKGSPVSAKVQVGAMYVGLVLLGSVFLFVTYHDILKLF